MIGINFGTHDEAPPPWFWHFLGQLLFAFDVSEFAGAPISRFKLILIDNWVTWVENHLCVVVFLQVGKDVKHLCQVTLSWEYQM